MSEFEIKENTGSIFKNDYKKDNPKAPDYKGTVNVGGKEHDIALWLSETKNGKKYFSVKFSEVWKKDGEPQKGEDEPEDSDLPF